MTVLSTSPTATRHFDMNIAAALGDINAAVIVQQLDYWMKKEGVGTIIEGVKYVYNTFVDWVNSQFRWLSVWQFRQAMKLLRSHEIVKVVRYKSRQWNQTNYYSLDYNALAEFIKSKTAEAGLALAPVGVLKDTPADNASFPAESIENVEMWSNSSQGEEYQTLEVRDSKLSSYEAKNTTKENTAKQEDNQGSKSKSSSSPSAAASLKNELEEEKEQKQKSSHKQSSTASNSQNKAKSEQNKSNIGEEKRDGKVDYIVNKELLSLLDSTGIPINKTVKDLLKLYSLEKVENAITIVKARKRESHIPNPSGYFVAALKGDWGSKNVVNDEGVGVGGVDKAAVFRHWYDLARELGYCSGQEVRDGERWINLSGAWEKWSDAVKRGYSLEYLKKIMKRNQSK